MPHCVRLESAPFRHQVFMMSETKSRNLMERFQMRAILALTVAGVVVGAASIFSWTGAMAQQTPKQTQTNTPPNQIDSIKTPEDKGLTEFWTAERLRSAQPMPMPRVDPSDTKK